MRDVLRRARGDDQKASEAIQDESHQEQHETEFDQRAQVQIAGGFREFIGDDGGNGIARRRKRSADLRVVADDHGDGHGFAQRARQRQKYRAHNSGASPGNHDFPGGFPARGAQRQRRFALIARNREQHFARHRNDERHDHDGQHNSRGQKSHSVVRP